MCTKKGNNHNNFVECLAKGNAERHSMKLIRSSEHRLFTVNVSKISLSAFDNKKYILDNGYDCLAHGHYRIKDL